MNAPVPLPPADAPSVLTPKQRKSDVIVRLKVFAMHAFAVACLCGATVYVELYTPAIVSVGVQVGVAFAVYGVGLLVALASHGLWGLVLFVPLGATLFAASRPVSFVFVGTAAWFTVAFVLWLFDLDEAARENALAMLDRDHSSALARFVLVITGTPHDVDLESPTRVDALAAVEEMRQAIALALLSGCVVAFVAVDAAVSPSTMDGPTAATVGILASLADVAWAACVAHTLELRATPDLFLVSATGFVTCALLLSKFSAGWLPFAPVYVACVVLAVGTRTGLELLRRERVARSRVTLWCLLAGIVLFTLFTQGFGYKVRNWWMLLGFAFDAFAFAFWLVVACVRATNGGAFMYGAESQTRVGGLALEVSVVSIWALSRIMLLALTSAGAFASFAGSDVIGWFVLGLALLDLVLTWSAAFEPPSNVVDALASSTSAVLFGMAVLLPSTIVNVTIVVSVFYVVLAAAIYTPWFVALRRKMPDTSTLVVRSVIGGGSFATGVLGLVATSVPHSLSQNSAAAWGLGLWTAVQTLWLVVSAAVSFSQVSESLSVGERQLERLMAEAATWSPEDWVEVERRIGLEDASRLRALVTMANAGDEETPRVKQGVGTMKRRTRA